MKPPITKDLYFRIVENRPFKFSAEEVNYRDGEGEEICRTCQHFFERVIDKFHTCEIFRPKDDASVEAEYVCDFHTVDGEEFPLLEE